ncbi:MAG: hypothetical protein IPI49_13935 [Myxococcales bacterium]|jgi:hypothetical protein|nr:hypothetical protein [Myxococcales bacterium]HRC57154.1 hypothetical protein [Kofleriaceae bacterium]
MAIRFVEIHPTPDPEQLNQEWVILENAGKSPFHTRGCGMTVGARGSNKKSLLGVIDPGFVLAPGEKMRMCTGNPGTQSHGTPPPEDAVKNYFLFLPKAYLGKGAGTVLTLTLRGLQVAKAEHDPAAASGLTADKTKPA